MKAIFLMLLLVDTAFAAGAPHEQGPLTSLILPALNFTALFAGIIFLLRKPLREGFAKKAEEVTALYYHAEEKEKEAKIKFDMYQEKMKNLEAEKTKVFTSAEAQVAEFERNAKEELKHQMSKAESDAHAKMIYEKNLMIRELNESLIDEVIKRTKTEVETNSALRAGITSKLAAEVRS